MHNDFYLALPGLCEALFGADAASPGAVHRPLSDRDRSALAALLAPDGPLLRLILRLSSDSSLLYEVAVDKLPAPTQRFLNSVRDHAKLPSIYAGKVKFDLAAPAAAYAAAAPSPLPDLSSDRLRPQASPLAMSGGLVGATASSIYNVRVMFNMLEFYMFSFARAATVSTKLRPSDARTGDSYDPRGPRAGSSSSSWRRDPSAAAAAATFVGADPAYFSALRAYLSYFAPSEAAASPAAVAAAAAAFATATAAAAPGAGAAETAAAMHLNPFAQGSPLKARFPAKSGIGMDGMGGQAARASPYSILGSRDPDRPDGREVTVSSFVLGIFVELWLNQNDPADAFRSPSWILPPLPQILCVKHLVRHMARLRLYELEERVLANQTDQQKIAS
ncbi:hypothetical protein HK405_013109, partial [Cladochytrium tenue]